MSVWVDDVPPAAKASGEEARAVFLAWEKLRVLYNAILVVESVGLGANQLGVPAFARLLLGGAIVANLCFCAGIVAEGYLSLLGVPRRGARPVLFVLGTSLAMLLTAVSVVGF